MKLLLLFVIIFSSFNLIAQDDELDEESLEAIKTEFILGCKGSDVKNTKTGNVTTYCECLWEYFEENYTLEDFADLMMKTGSKKKMSQFLMKDEGLMLHLVNCYAGDVIGEDGDSATDGEEADPNKAIKKVTTDECIKTASKMKKKFKGVDIEGYCSCASEKMYNEFTLEEILAKKFSNSDKFRNILTQCMLQAIE